MTVLHNAGSQYSNRLYPAFLFEHDAIAAVTDSGHTNNAGNIGCQHETQCRHATGMLTNFASSQAG